MATDKSNSQDQKVRKLNGDNFEDFIGLLALFQELTDQIFISVDVNFRMQCTLASLLDMGADPSLIKS